MLSTELMREWSRGSTLTSSDGDILELDEQRILLHTGALVEQSLEAQLYFVVDDGDEVGPQCIDHNENHAQEG